MSDAADDLTAYDAGFQRQFKDALIRRVPRRLHLPARYWYVRFRRRLAPEITLAVGFTVSRRTCLDIGASVGLYTYLFARRFENVEAFEPIGSSADVIEAGGLEGLHVHRVALSDHDGTEELSIPAGPRPEERASLTQRFDGGRSMSVQTRTLDSYGFEDVDLVKIDVEGHEWEVIQGAVATLQRDMPVLVVEIEQRHQPDRSIDEVFRAITSLGYAGFFLTREGLRPLDDFRGHVHQSKHGSPGYVNNFIFRAASPRITR